MVSWMRTCSASSSTTNSSKTSTTITTSSSSSSGAVHAQAAAAAHGSTACIQQLTGAGCADLDATVTHQSSSQPSGILRL
jgi:hypothetical protein